MTHSAAARYRGDPWPNLHRKKSRLRDSSLLSDSWGSGSARYCWQEFPSARTSSSLRNPLGLSIVRVKHRVGSRARTPPRKVTPVEVQPCAVTWWVIHRFLSAGDEPLTHTAVGTHSRNWRPSSGTLMVTCPAASASKSGDLLNFHSAEDGDGIPTSLARGISLTGFRANTVPTVSVKRRLGAIDGPSEVPSAHFRTTCAVAVDVGWGVGLAVVDVQAVSTTTTQEERTTTRRCQSMNSVSHTPNHDAIVARSRSRPRHLNELHESTPTVQSSDAEGQLSRSAFPSDLIPAS